MTAFPIKLSLLTASIFCFSISSHCFAMEESNQENSSNISISTRSPNISEDNISIHEEEILRSNTYQFYNGQSSWEQGPSSRTSISFSKYQGDKDLRKEHNTKIEIPEDGIYSISASYLWTGNEQEISTAETRLKIGLDNRKAWRNHPQLVRGIIEEGTLNYTCSLQKNDNITVDILGHNSLYSLGGFRLFLEKIN